MEKERAGENIGTDKETVAVYDHAAENMLQSISRWAHD